jgi:hypothetical protein
MNSQLGRLGGAPSVTEEVVFGGDMVWAPPRKRGAAMAVVYLGRR